MKQFILKIFSVVLLCLSFTSCDSLVLVSDPYYVPEYHYYYYRPVPHYHPVAPPYHHSPAVRPPQKPSTPSGSSRPHGQGNSNNRGRGRR